MHCLFSGPITGHDICPNTIPSTVKLHKWYIVPVAIEISAGNLFIEKVMYITHDKYIFLGHPLRQCFGHRAIITEWHILLWVVAFSNPINSFVHLCSRFPGDIIMASFGRLCCPQLQSFVDVLRSWTCGLPTMYSSSSTLTLTAYILTRTATRLPTLTNRMTDTLTDTLTDAVPCLLILSGLSQHPYCTLSDPTYLAY
jgi:hypothetical protein